MNKIKRIALLLLIPILSASCSNWLDIIPFDSLEEERVYENERNANSALNGIYIMLTYNNLYGRDLSAGMVDVLGQNFSVPGISGDVEHMYAYLSQFNYTSGLAIDVIANVFTTAYTAIANCNEFLEMVQANRENFSEENYAFYMGEAIAIRTLLHFDMMRLFGPVGTSLDEDSVPYYNASTDIPTSILTANALLDILIADMDEAIEYLSNDYILTEGLNSEDENETDPDFFRSFRNMRMNYYAANAIKARMCLYKGTAESRTEAYNIASRMLNGQDPRNPSIARNFNSVFSFVSRGDQEADYMIFYPEVLLGIHNTARPDVHRSLFSADLDEANLLSAGTAFWGRLYTTGSAGNDGNGAGLRRNMWTYEATKNIYLFNRLSPDVTILPYRYQFQCIMRLGELYLIAAETAPDVETKRSWLDDMRTGKGYDPGNTNGLTEAQLNSVIEFELRKDTYGEGQYFFYAKRRNLASFYGQQNTLVSMTRARYVIPLPDVEIDFRRQE